MAGAAATLAGVPQQPAAGSWEALRRDLAADVARVSDRLRSLSTARLAGPPAPSAAGEPEQPSRAATGRHAAQLMADAAAELEAVAGGSAPLRRTLPQLADLAVGDQVAVTGHDVLAALDALGALGALGALDDPPSAAEHAVRNAATALADVRRRL